MAQEKIGGTLGTVAKTLAVTAAAGGAGFGGYKAGKRVGAKKAANALTQAFSEQNEIENQQIAREFYDRGLQEANVEKSAEITQEDLSNAAGIVLEKLGFKMPKAVGEFGAHVKGVFSGPDKEAIKKIVSARKGGQFYPKWVEQGFKHQRMSHLKELGKNPITIGAGALGIGAGGAAGGTALMEKESALDKFGAKKANVASRLMHETAEFFRNMGASFHAPKYGPMKGKLGKGFSKDVKKNIRTGKGEQAYQSIPSWVRKSLRGAAGENLKNIAKNPLVYGTAGAGAGAGGVMGARALMEKESSDSVYDMIRQEAMRDELEKLGANPFKGYGGLLRRAVMGSSSAEKSEAARLTKLMKGGHQKYKVGTGRGQMVNEEMIKSLGPNRMEAVKGLAKHPVTIGAGLAAGGAGAGVVGAKATEKK